MPARYDAGVSSRDTRRDARRVHIAALRRLGAAARVELALRMSSEARRISVEGIRSRDPGVSEPEARLRMLRRVLGEELHAAAYGRTRE
jgi:hypothetical protein